MVRRRDFLSDSPSRPGVRTAPSSAVRVSGQTVLGALVVCLACTSDPQPPATEEAGGPQRIISVEPSWDRATIDPSHLVDIGSAGGAHPHIFVSVATVRFSDTGKIVVADSGADRVFVFTESGDHVVTQGTTGQGPGEFRDLARALPYRGDSLVAFDFGNNRSLVFPTEPGESRAISANFRSVRTPVFAALGDGGLLGYQGTGRSRDRVDGQWDSTIVVHVPATGEPREVGRFPSTQYLASGGGQPLALSPRSVLAGGPNGFYWARTDRYEIEQYDAEGALVRTLGRPSEPMAIGASEAAEYRTASIESARMLGAQAAEVWGRRLSETDFAPTRPLFGSAFVDHEDRLWISELPWPSRFDPPRRWSVFAASGEWLGDVMAPEGVLLGDARGDRVVGTWADQLGLHHVRVYRFEAG